jgi:glycosyltransferase involved in cell wall biosynthesis
MLMRSTRPARHVRARGVLIVVENLSVPFDRRVWLEATALRDAGYTVSVICPRGGRMDSEPYVNLDGIAIYRYALPRTATGLLSFAREYSAALLKTTWLALEVFRARGFRVIQSCNPPDFFFLVSLMYRPFGVRFVFDHHDLAPELFKVQFGTRFPLLYRLLLFLERCSFRAADTVITTNLSLREVAIRRGGVPPERIFVVRNGPDTTRFRSLPACERLDLGFPFVVAYLGVMGPQDGVDLALHAADLIVHRHGRADVGFFFIGDGDAGGRLRALASALRLDANVRFLGRLPDGEVVRYLGSSDVCLCPDPANGFNELHTMNKTADYLAMGRAVVAFDLAETRRSAEDAAVYARANDVEDFAAKILQLLGDPEQRERMGLAGIDRVRDCLSWDHSRAVLLAAYAHAFRGR